MPTVENDGLTRIFHNGIILIVLCLRVVFSIHIACSHLSDVSNDKL